MLVTRGNKFAMGAFIVGAGVVVPYALTEGIMALTNSEQRRKELEEKVNTLAYFLCQSNCAACSRHSWP